jgi:hypothetical protein
MDASPDITLHLPAEHLPALSEVIHAGLQRAKLDNKTRNELMTWWEAEQEFLNEEIESAIKKS